MPHYLRRARRAWKTHTDNSPGKLEVTLACKATTIARLSETWVQNKSTIGAMLGSVIPDVVMCHYIPIVAQTYAQRETQLTLPVLTMLKPCLTGMRH